MIDSFIKSHAGSTAISCKSFIVTVFGDVISQHGGWIWLGSMISSLEPLGFSERLIRTSVFRLVKEDWLQVKKIGRKSFYAFTDSANKHYTKAARRIYAGKVHHSDGRWLIVMPCFVDETNLPVLKRQLLWMGFSALSSGAYAHPSIDQTSLEETISELALSDSVIVFSSRTFDQKSNLVLKRLVHEKWGLETLDTSYQKIIDDYSPLLSMLNNDKIISDQQSYFLRCLLIHEYRRVLLKDHELPKDMLPENWSGFYANELVKKLYAKFSKGSCRYIGQLENAEGPLPRASIEFNKRFN